MSDILVYGRNVAAIASFLCLDLGNLQTLQEGTCDHTIGKAHVWEVVAVAGKVFTEEERAHGSDAAFHWYGAIEDFTDRMAMCLSQGELPTELDIRRMAWEAIGENSTTAPKLTAVFPENTLN